MEVIVGITLFSIFSSVIILGYSNMIKIENKAKLELYQAAKDADEISKKYYIPGE